MLSHSYKSHGSGLAPWLPGHSQLCAIQYAPRRLFFRPWKGLERSLHGIYGSLLSKPWKGLERRLQGVPVWCSVLYNMHNEGSSPGPGRAWRGAFMAFTEASSPSPGRAWRRGFKVFLFGALCYTICTTKAPPQALGRSLHGI